MTSLNSFAEELALTFGRGTDLLFIENLKRKILHFRQILIKQNYDRERVFVQSTIQAFDIKLTEADKNGSKVYISEKLPKPIMVNGRNEPFISVSNSLIDTKRKVYGWISPEELYYLSYRKFTKPSDYYTYENDRIISIKSKSLRIRAVWDNPIEVFEFSKEEDIKLGCKNASLEDSCFYNGDYYLEETMAANILRFFSDDKSNKEENNQEEERRS